MTTTNNRPRIMDGLKVKVVATDIATTGDLSSITATEPTAAVRRVKFVDYNDLLAMDLPPLEWVIPDVLPVGLVSAIVAQSGTGKTWLAFDLMRKISAGGQWAGKFELQPRCVGFIDLEGNYTTLKERITLLDAGEPLEGGARGRVLFNSDLGQIDATNPDTQNDLIAAVRESGIEVLFIDSLSKTHLEDENSERMKDVMSALEHIARVAPCTVVLIHHMGKDATRGARGSSAIKAALQHVIDLQAGDNNPEGLARGVKVSLSKAKSSPLIPFITTFSLEVVKDESGRRVAVRCQYDDADLSITTPKGATIKERVKGVILTAMNLNVYPPKQRSQVVNDLMQNGASLVGEPVKKNTANDAINELVSAGKLRAEGEGRNVTLRLVDVNSGQAIPLMAGDDQTATD